MASPHHSADGHEGSDVWSLPQIPPTRDGRPGRSSEFVSQRPQTLTGCFIGSAGGLWETRRGKCREARLQDR